MSESAYITGALIAVGGGIVVWVLTSVTEHLRRRADDSKQRQTTLRHALANYLVALDSVALELEAEMPVPRRTRVDDALDRLAEWVGLSVLLDWLGRLIRRGAYGRRYYELTDRLFRASAELRLVAPPEVETRMRDVEDLLRRWAPGDPGWREDWLAIRKTIRAEFRAIVTPEEARRRFWRRRNGSDALPQGGEQRAVPASAEQQTERAGSPRG